MKYTHLLTVALVCGSVMTLMTSCFSTKVTRAIPQAVNTVNSVGLKELNLKRTDYEILQTVTAEAVVVAKYRKESITIEGGDGEFVLYYELDNQGNWHIDKYRGIAKLGYLSDDYLKTTLNSVIAPEELARKMATYRLINEVDMVGGDGIIEPVISTNVDSNGEDNIIFKTTAKGKVVRLKTDN